jgi:hypothetical protein
MDPRQDKLIRELRNAGLSDQAIDAAWPSWWTEDAAASSSGRAELRFALARNLGLSPKHLLGERVEFVWKDDARFKNLTAEDSSQRAALASFGVAVGRILLRATPPVTSLLGVSALELRKAILAEREFVDLLGLLSTCWAAGLPTIHLRVFPLTKKGMNALVVEVSGRHAILLGRDANYPAPIAFTLAHEIGHIALGHLEGAPALVDLGDPAEVSEFDPQENEADRYALTLLTGQPEPDVRTNLDKFTARSLAQAVLYAGPPRRIEPGTLALCVGYRLNTWPVAIASLRYVYDEQKMVWMEVNGIADAQLRWGELNDDSAHYLRNVMAQ